MGQLGRITGLLLSFRRQRGILVAGAGEQSIPIGDGPLDLLVGGLRMLTYHVVNQSFYSGIPFLPMRRVTVKGFLLLTTRVEWLDHDHGR